jgi:hypothetical protein
MSWEVVSCWIEGHPGLASWVQAIGSIAALGIAFFLASSQRRDQEKAVEEAMQNKTDALIAVVESAAIFVTVLGTFVRGKPVAFVFKENWKLVNRQWLESSIHSLTQLPAHELGRGDLVRGYFGILASVNEIRRLIDHAVSSDAFQEQEFVFMYEEVLNQVAIVQATWISFKKCASTKK